MRTNPPGFSRVSAQTRMGGRSVTQRQIQLRSHDADGACPSRRRPGLSLGANTRELIHTLPHPRYDREAAPRRRTRSRIPAGSDAEPSPSQCGLPTPLALASAARARRRRNASRHVSSSTSARDGHHPPFAASIPRLTILPPRAFPSPPGATRGRGENSPCQSRASDSLLEEVASRLVSRTTRRCRRRPR